MSGTTPSKGLGIGIGVILSIIVIGVGAFLNASLGGKITDVKEDFGQRLEALTEEVTAGVKPAISRNFDDLQELYDLFVAMESKIASISAIVTQSHDMLYAQFGDQRSQDTPQSDLIRTTHDLQQQIKTFTETVEGIRTRENEPTPLFNELLEKVNVVDRKATALIQTIERLEKRLPE